MKIKSLLAMLLATTGSLFGCSADANDFQSVNVDEFEKVLADSSVVRLDVRTTGEYAEGHIADALNIDVLEDGFEQTALAKIEKSRTVALYCRSGRRSKRAASILAKHGYKVIELNTGFNGWQKAGKPVVK